MNNPRQLYHYGIDESAGTYVTNYVVVAVILIGFVMEFVSKPKAIVKAEHVSTITNNIFVPTLFHRLFSLHSRF